MTIKTITLTSGVITSINSAANISVGMPFSVVNESRLHRVYLKESNSIPTTDRSDSRGLRRGAELFITEDSEEIWAFTTSGSVILSIQGL